MALYRVNMNATSMIYNCYKFCVNVTKLDLSKIQTTVKNEQFSLRFVSPYSRRKINLQNYINKRKHEASRSIIVQVATFKSCKELLLFCSNFGPIEKAYFYTLPKQHQFVLIEFRNKNSLDNIYANTAFMDESNYVPCRTNVLWFRKTKQEKTNQKYYFGLPKINVCSPLIVQENSIKDALISSLSISNQMTNLYQKYKLDELEIRLKFQTIVQLEKCFQGFFPNITIHPFGSFVNGYGKKLSDLDLILFTDVCKKDSTSNRLVYHGKSTNIDEKQHTHAFMGVLADSMKYIIPGIFNVRKIFNARVPIIKFQNFFTHTECDLSLSNTIATYMSELLFLYGEEDERVRPLVFTIRKWAEDNKLTSIHPGKTITNFSLTLLVIFYLQQVDILPGINSITTFSEISNNNKNNVRGIYTNYSPNLSKSHVNNDAHLSALLIDLFKFYATFDFGSQKICLRTATAIKSMHNAALYICNPFETELNVSKNVSFNEIQRMKALMTVAISNLQNTKPIKTRKWGILSILNFPESHNVSINVLKIFDKETNTENTQDDKTITNVQENDVSDTLNVETNDEIVTNKNLM
ncbi:PREDICTED: poly(A) RNA polymerase, mitochondrial-like isoform X2 [Polistes dominula]|uniref:Poly(A) RNA polymerase, mitochondrial-like isoform X2 n=1 Tax=Polistes dominula TaxID=743375 RepID=A0ABM1IS84_POLDO|nr:PREDICTED: poly(A) RNA polymerase, mitochondrial-like isoform X2 [Polistes dominula]